MQVNHQARAALAERRRNKTRARLIEAAMRVIAAKGPGGVSVSDIAAASGLSRGAFYNYFPQPDDLLHAVAGKIREDLRSVAAEAVSSVEDPPEQLARAALAYFERGLADPVWGWVWLQIDASAQAPAPMVTQGFMSLFRRGVERGRFRQGDPAAASAVIFGSMRMAARFALTAANPPPHLARDTVRIVLIGLGMTEAGADEVLERAGRSPAPLAAPGNMAKSTPR
jgi:AcrR family transcriptional regulator